MTVSIFDNHPGLDAFHAQIAGHRTWADAAETAMKLLAGSGQAFSSDDLRDMLAAAGVDEPLTPSAYGGLFISWSRQGLIRRVGDGTSRGRRRNGGRRGLWVGVKCVEEVI